MKNVVLGALAILAGGAAVYLTLTRDEGDQLPDTPESAAPWVCDHCGHVEMLTAKQFNEWLSSEHRYLDENVPRGRIYFYCPDCGNPSLCDGDYCEVHDKYYVVWDTQGLGPHLCDLCVEEARRQMSP